MLAGVNPFRGSLADLCESVVDGAQAIRVNFENAGLDLDAVHNFLLPRYAGAMMVVSLWESQTASVGVYIIAGFIVANLD
jgi:hypothetical protein